MVTTGGAVADACRLLMAPIARIGAHLLQCKESDVEIRNGRIHGPQGSVEFREIGRAWYHHPEDLPADMDQGGLTATAGHKAHDPGVFSYSAHAAVVAVDPDIGSVEVLDYAIVADCGTRVNPLLVEGQVLGGFSNGLGNALLEESSYDEWGQPTATTLADYTAPTAPSMPNVKLDFIETPSPFSLFGMKGIGENGAIGPPAAIVNAVNDALRALGASVFETPVSARRVREAIARAQRRP
jgi:carbon-monoxide dehydrogenase large subunit